MHGFNSLHAACVLWLIFCSAASAAVEARLHGRAVTRGGLVRLGDIAEVAAADDEQKQRLAAIALMPAPAPGTQWFVPRRAIEDLLAAQGIDHHELRLDGAAQVEIASIGESSKNGRNENESVPPAGMSRRAAILAGNTHETHSTKLSAERVGEIRDELRSAIVSYLNEKICRDGEWRVTCDVLDRHLALLHEATSPLLCQGGAAPWTGRQRFMVSFHSRNGRVQVPVYADVTAAAMPVVVALRPIARGDVITAADVESRTADYVLKTSSRRHPIDNLETLIGMEARQAIQAGETVFSDQVQPPLMVKRGDIVTVSSQAGGIRIRATARARQDGARGDLVQVESLETRERFDVRVAGPGETAVFALARPPKAESDERVDTARR